EDVRGERARPVDARGNRPARRLACDEYRLGDEHRHLAGVSAGDLEAASRCREAGVAVGLGDLEAVRTVPAARDRRHAPRSGAALRARGAGRAVVALLSLRPLGARGPGAALVALRALDALLTLLAGRAGVALVAFRPLSTRSAVGSGRAVRAVRTVVA